MASDTGKKKEFRFSKETFVQSNAINESDLKSMLFEK
jgi:hypothetical protein